MKRSNEIGFKEAAAWAMAGIALSGAAMSAGFALFVLDKMDWAAFAAEILTFIGSTIGLGLILVGVSFLAEDSRRTKISFMAVGTMSGAIVIPVLLYGGKKVWEMAYVDPTFTRVCQHAHVTYGARVERPSGVLLNVQKGTDFTAEFLLAQSDLDFVERPASNLTSKSGGYERLEVIGKRVRRVDDPRFSDVWRTRFKASPVSDPTAPVEVTVTNLRSLAGEAIVERKTEVRRRSDKLVMGSSLVYLSKGSGSCPAGEFPGQFHTMNFVLRVIEGRY
jgi:hypothetical protein